MSAAATKELAGVMLGEYRVGALIGVGGMGAVYEGYHPVIGKRVAVKVLLPQLSADVELVKRFVSEARSVNEIRHRNIVDIFSFGQLPDGSHYFLMEFLEGEPFDYIIRNRGPLPVHEALFWCEEVLEALGAAHDFGIIHRDVKPSNVFMVQPRAGRRYIKLLDFGIAKLASGRQGTTTQASVVIGTPVYMSPEQARGRAISPTTDIYSIGCMLFELITGRVLFPAENQNQVMFMHAEDAPPLAKSLNPLVPDSVDVLLQKLLQKDPLARPQTCEEVRAMCEALRKEINPDTSFTQGPNRPPTGDPLRVIQGRTPSPHQAMEDAMIRNRATPAGSPPTPAEAAMFSPTMVRSGPHPEVPVAPSQVVPTKSKVPLYVMGGVTTLALLFAGWQAFVDAPAPVELIAPPPVTVVEPAIAVVVPSAPVAPVAPLAVAVAPPEIKPLPEAPEPPPPREGRINADGIEKRLGHLEKRLKKKEAETGDVDGILRQFLKQARIDAKAADSDVKRRAVWRNLDDIKAQLDGR